MRPLGAISPKALREMCTKLETGIGELRSDMVKSQGELRSEMTKNHGEPVFPSVQSVRLWPRTGRTPGLRPLTGTDGRAL